MSFFFRSRQTKFQIPTTRGAHVGDALSAILNDLVLRYEDGVPLFVPRKKNLQRFLEFSRSVLRAMNYDVEAPGADNFVSPLRSQRLRKPAPRRIMQRMADLRYEGPEGKAQLHADLLELLQLQDVPRDDVMASMRMALQATEFVERGL